MFIVDNFLLYDLSNSVPMADIILHVCGVAGNEYAPFMVPCNFTLRVIPLLISEIIVISGSVYTNIIVT